MLKLVGFFRSLLYLHAALPNVASNFQKLQFIYFLTVVQFSMPKHGVYGQKMPFLSHLTHGSLSCMAMKLSTVCLYNFFLFFVFKLWFSPGHSKRKWEKKTTIIYLLPADSIALKWYSEWLSRLVIWVLWRQKCWHWFIQSCNYTPSVLWKRCSVHRSCFGFPAQTQLSINLID